jgi:type IV pilus assembly protein PilX
MSTRPRLAARRERGTTLFVALVMLVAMSLAGIALMRSVDTNVLIAGNLAFRQGATAGGDWGVENARVWVTANSALLNADQPAGAAFYWANWQHSTDLIGNNPDPTVQNYDWESGAPADLGTDSAGNRVQYVIHRLCDTAGAPIDVQCVNSSLSGGGASPLPGESKQVKGLNMDGKHGTIMVLYRVTVRISGPRNTVSFVQAVLN